MNSCYSDTLRYHTNVPQFHELRNVIQDSRREVKKGLKNLRGIKADRGGAKI